MALPSTLASGAEGSTPRKLTAANPAIAGSGWQMTLSLVVHRDQFRALPAQIFRVPVAVPDYGSRLQVHQRLGARKASPPQCPVHDSASGQPRDAGPQLDDHLPAIGQPKPDHSGQVACAEQLLCRRRAQPARASFGQRIHVHGWAAGLGHHPILPKPPASDH